VVGPARQPAAANKDDYGVRLPASAMRGCRHVISDAPATLRHPSHPRTACSWLSCAAPSTPTPRWCSSGLPPGRAPFSVGMSAAPTLLGWRLRTSQGVPSQAWGLTQRRWTGGARDWAKQLEWGGGDWVWHGMGIVHVASRYLFVSTQIGLYVVDMVQEKESVLGSECLLLGLTLQSIAAAACV
jgi:hypothetical protein